MKVDIYVLNRHARQYIAGTLELRRGAVVIVPRTEDAGDHCTLQWVVSRKIYALIDGEDTTIDPATEPEKFLMWLHRGLTGTMVRASKVQGSHTET